MYIKDLLGAYNINVPKTISGNLMPIKLFTAEEVRNFKIDKQYQRHISPAYIKKSGSLDLTKLTPIVACHRPESFEEDGGYYVVDGQHRTFRVVHSDYEGLVPVQVYTHDPQSTLEECIKFEAILFEDMNTLSKRTSKLDNVRAGICSQKPEALHILNVMEMLNITCDNFGSENDDARELGVFTHFYHLCTSDYKAQHTARITEGYRLLNEMYPNEKTVDGYMLRACCLIAEFEKALTNGKKKSFGEYLRVTLPKVKTVKALVKGYATMDSPRYIMHDIIAAYNEVPGVAGALKVGDDIISRLSNKALGGNPRFAHPNKEK